MSFVEYVRDYCKKYGISGYELSQKTGISVTYCYDLLKGNKTNPSMKIVQLISSCLGINYSNFIYVNKPIGISEEELKEQQEKENQFYKDNSLIKTAYTKNK